MMQQLSFLDGDKQQTNNRAGTFTNNMKLPMHRWFRYSAGFSAEWVEGIVNQHTLNNARPRILDPFCGSGTTMIAAAKAGADAVGYETHPFVARIARTKLCWDIDVTLLDDIARQILLSAKNDIQAKPKTVSTLLLKCYTDENLIALEALRTAHQIGQNSGDHKPIYNLIWLAITSILRECSGVGTAQWQYVLPNKTKARVSHPFIAFNNRIEMFKHDILYAQSHMIGNASVIEADARNLGENGTFDLVITSPPYPNNYDYADATRLEMTFWGEVDSWGDLQNAVRQFLIRSCSQHAAAEKLKLDDLLENKVLAPIYDEISQTCRELDIVRQDKGGKKTYHTMVAAYFIDLAKVWLSLREVTNAGGKAIFVIGDSAPYGVYLPCDKWLGELALASGFKTWNFEKLRDRNIKWKNRKHRVPLKEGILTVEA